MINPFKKTYTTYELRIFNFLSSLRLFKSLTFKEMAYFLPVLHERKYQRDEVVFFREDPSHALYLLKQGEVLLNIDVNNTFETLTTVKGGSLLGESCLLENQKRMLNAFVISDTAVFYVIPQDNIFSIFENHEKVRSKMLKELATIYSEYNAEMYKAYRSSFGFFHLSQIYGK
jgi:CRP/FNR family cyclic AMP-dependent transcriptional regulator